MGKKLRTNDFLNLSVLAIRQKRILGIDGYPRQVVLKIEVCLDKLLRAVYISWYAFVRGSK